MEKVQIIVWGIGKVGKGLIRLSAAEDRMEVVEGICRPYPDPQDAAKSMAGKDLGELAALGEKLGVEGLEQGLQVSIEGEPGLEVSLKGEVLRKGYVAAYAHAFNAIPQVMDARPGLVSVKDLPPATTLR